MDLPGLYVSLTERVVSLLGGSHSLAHLNAGLLIYVSVQVAARDRRASLIALQAVAGAEFLNEAIEAIHFGSPRWADTLGDVAVTLAWPAILYAVARYRRQRWARETSRLARPLGWLMLRGRQPAPGMLPTF